MKYKYTMQDRIFNLVNITFLLILAIVMVYPFIYVLSVSLSDPYYIELNKIWLFPMGTKLDAYKLFYDSAIINIFRAYANSFIYALSTVLGTVFLTMMTAYPLLHRRLIGKTLFNILIVIPMFFGGTFIQVYVNLSNLGMINTIWSIIIPSFLTTFNVIIVRTSMDSIDHSLRESAVVDGAGEWRILFSIYFPLSKPILAIISLYAFVGQWNNFFGPLLFLSDSKLFPLTLVLQRAIIFQQSAYATFFLDESTKKSMQAAAMVVTFLPMFFLYPFVQKYFVKGVMIGSIKG